MVEDAVTGSGGKRIFVRRYDNENADYVLVLVPATAGVTTRSPSTCAAITARRSIPST
jgi:hypothetical protein